MGKQKDKKKERTEDKDNKKMSSEETTDQQNNESQEEPREKHQAEQPAKSLERQLQELNDKYMRTKAELENYRKRMQRDAAEIREYAKASTIEEFLSVFDHFQMALDHVDQTPDFETLKQGMKMILGEFHKTFDALGVEQVNAKGQKFNPAEHDAVAQEPSDTVPREQVIRQWKCGYRLGNRLLRPAAVVVSSGLCQEESASAEASQNESASKTGQTTTADSNSSETEERNEPNKQEEEK